MLPLILHRLSKSGYGPSLRCRQSGGMHASHDYRNECCLNRLRLSEEARNYCPRNEHITLPEEVELRDEAMAESDVFSQTQQVPFLIAFFESEVN